VIEVVRPSAAEIAALVAENAHRFPEKAMFQAPEGAGDVSLPVLLGIPSGACKLPGGKFATSAWSDTIAVTFKMLKGADASPEQLAADCILWPDAGTWGKWVERWPALPGRVVVALRRKLASSLEMIDEEPKGEMPEAVQAAIARMPSAVWRKLEVDGPGRPSKPEFYDMVVAPPDAGVWRMFCAAMKVRGEAYASLARGLAESCVVVCVKDGAAVTAEALFDRYPGHVILVGLTAAHLAGISASFTMGEW